MVNFFKSLYKAVRHPVSTLNKGAHWLAKQSTKAIKETWKEAKWANNQLRQMKLVRNMEDGFVRGVKNIPGVREGTKFAREALKLGEGLISENTLAYVLSKAHLGSKKNILAAIAAGEAGLDILTLGAVSGLKHELKSADDLFHGDLTGAIEEALKAAASSALRESGVAEAAGARMASLSSLVGAERAAMMLNGVQKIQAANQTLEQITDVANFVNLSKDWLEGINRNPDNESDRPMSGSNFGSIGGYVIPPYVTPAHQPRLMEASVYRAHAEDAAYQAQIGEARKSMIHDQAKPPEEGGTNEAHGVTTNVSTG